MSEDDPMIDAFKGIAAAATFIATILLLVAGGVLLFRAVTS